MTYPFCNMIHDSNHKRETWDSSEMIERGKVNYGKGIFN